MENAIERACVTSTDEFICPDNLPPEIVNSPAAKLPIPVDLSRPLAAQLPDVIAAFEDRYLRRALKKSQGDLGRVCKLAGLPRPALLDKLAQYKIDRSRFRESKDT